MFALAPILTGLLTFLAVRRRFFPAAGWSGEQESGRGGRRDAVCFH